MICQFKTGPAVNSMFSSLFSQAPTDWSKLQETLKWCRADLVKKGFQAAIPKLMTFSQVFYCTIPIQYSLTLLVSAYQPSCGGNQNTCASRP